MREIPESMQSDLRAWNGSDGIDLDGWVSCSGTFSLAVGYTTVFWPSLVEFEGYILHANFSVESLRAFERAHPGDRVAVESVMNHRHLSDIQHPECVDIAADKLLVLGRVLEEMYRAKLAWQFPMKPCEVSLQVAEDHEDLTGYQVTFWQKARSFGVET